MKINDYENDIRDVLIARGSEIAYRREAIGNDYLVYTISYQDEDIGRLTVLERSIDGPQVRFEKLGQYEIGEDNSLHFTKPELVQVFLDLHKELTTRFDSFQWLENAYQQAKAEMVVKKETEGLPSEIQGRDRAILVMWYKGYTMKEIGLKLDRSDKTIRNRLGELRHTWGEKVVPKRK